MKIYKAVEASDLESCTLDGWQLHNGPISQSKIHTHHSQSRPSTNEEYARGICGYVTDPPKVFFGDVLIFIVWKDQETITKEVLLAEGLRKMTDRASVAENNVKRLEEQNARQLEAIQNEKKVTEIEREAKIFAQTRYRKLESDLAKVRTAIGDLKMKEIVG